MKSSYRTITSLGIAIICMSCFCSPMYLFTDFHYLPKLYLFVIGATIYIASSFLLESKVGNNVSVSEYFNLFYMIYIIMSECECAYVISDMVRYGHNTTGETGTFDNPAGLALSLSISVSMIIILLFKTKKRWMKILLLIGSTPVVFILLTTNSRTGLICLTLYVLILLRLFLNHFFSKNNTNKIVFSATAIILLVSVLLYTISNKPDSTTGRMFILEQSFRAIKKHPFIGYGPYGFQSEYMLQQANFFKENSDSIYENNADEVRYPMNEFVYLWFNYGIIGPVLLTSLYIFPFILFFRKKRELTQELLLPLLSVIIFSFFSYPFHYQSSWLVFLLCFLVPFHVVCHKISISFNLRMCLLCLIGALLAIRLSIDIYYEYQWRKAEILSFKGKHKEALNRYEYLYGYFQGNRFFLYDYAMAAFKGGNMQYAHYLINESGRHWNGYARELLSGDICLNLNEYDEALEHFTEAHFMCPVRFAPLEGMYKLYNLTGNDTKSDSIAKIIANKRVKVKSIDVERIKNVCK